MPAVVLTTKRATSRPAPSGRAWARLFTNRLGISRLSSTRARLRRAVFGNDLGPPRATGRIRKRSSTRG